MGSVGIYAYRAIETSTRAQLQRELTTLLESDIAALDLWVESQKALVRGEARGDLLEPVLELLEIARSANDLKAELRAADAGRRLRAILAPTVKAHRVRTFVLLDPDALVLADTNSLIIGRRLPVRKEPWDALRASETVFVRAVRDLAGDSSALLVGDASRTIGTIDLARLRQYLAPLGLAW